ncbi:hypothetical protein EXN66_Car021943 [Channa argus]|uniref:Uncharacterized protein n=1 Tax=Channa argus TaxID=215402 RepID=A0A6G1QU73_CHAAH|nr:hypothetical protein EXN66_Car021943 [Channa argus]
MAPGLLAGSVQRVKITDDVRNNSNCVVMIVWWRAKPLLTVCFHFSIVMLLLSHCTAKQTGETGEDDDGAV